MDPIRVRSLWARYKGGNSDLWVDPTKQDSPAGVKVARFRRKREPACPLRRAPARSPAASISIPFLLLSTDTAPRAYKAACSETARSGPRGFREVCAPAAREPREQ